MLLLLILPLLISGYCVQQWNYKHFYQLHRYTGQLLYLKSAYLGALCLIWSFFVSSILLSITPFKICNTTIGWDVLGFLSNFLTKTLKIERKSLPFFMILTFGSFIIALIWSYGQNTINTFYRFLNFNKKVFIEIENREPTLKDRWNTSKFGYILKIKQKVFCDNPLDDLLLTSYEESKDLMLHMDDKKVYIGFVMTLSEPTESDSLAQEIAIFPLKSGYRDKDNLTVTITTQYEEDDGLYIILRRSEIISATTYDPNIFQGFMDKQKQENQTFFEKVTTKIPLILNRPSIDNPPQQS